MRRRQSNPRVRLCGDLLADELDSDRLDHGRLADVLLDRLRACAEAGDPIASVTLDQIAHDGAVEWVRKIATSRRRFFADPRTGEVLGAREYAGIRSRAHGGVPDGSWQQKLFESLNREELVEWLRDRASQRDTLNAYLRLGEQVLAAWDRFPDAGDVGEVCRLAGIGLPDDLAIGS